MDHALYLDEDLVGVRHELVLLYEKEIVKMLQVRFVCRNVFLISGTELFGLLNMVLANLEHCLLGFLNFLLELQMKLFVHRVLEVIAISGLQRQNLLHKFSHFYSLVVLRVLILWDHSIQWIDDFNLTRKFSIKSFQLLEIGVISVHDALVIEGVFVVGREVCELLEILCLLLQVWAHTGHMFSLNTNLTNQLLFNSIPDLVDIDLIVFWVGLCDHWQY